MTTVDLPSLGMVIAFLGSWAAVDYGVDPAHTVTIQCLTGRSLEKYLVLNGPVSITARYDGMKIAFARECEIFVPATKGGRLEVPSLTKANYNALIDGAAKKMESRAKRNNSRKQVVRKKTYPLFAAEDATTTPQQNNWLHIHQRFPLWHWAFEEYDRLIRYALAWLAIGLLPSLSIAKFIATNQIPKGFIFFTITFVINHLYLGLLLDIGKREICYIRVGISDITPEKVSTWEKLLQKAEANGGIDAQQAIDDLRNGHVRRYGDEIGVPVIGLQPRIGFEMASWLCVLHPLRQFLLSICAFALKTQHEWAVAFVSISIVQANLQKILVQRFLTSAETTEIYWFRRVPEHQYDEVKPESWVIL